MINVINYDGAVDARYGNYCRELSFNSDLFSLAPSVKPAVTLHVNCQAAVSL